MKRVPSLPFWNSLPFAACFVAASLIAAAESQAAQPNDKSPLPNVLLIMTDDQGYGDLSCHGNKELKTPALDVLHRESTRLTNFHVDPTCSPTRSALLTGRYSSRTGVWHTIAGRSLMRKDETTMAQLFSAAGYTTGIFGKWHLGDYYPLRPQDRGFQEVLIHGGGGVGQTPDFWGNDYFDDTYFHNGKPEKFSGYCTDVFFGAAERFIEANRERPFFSYLVTNAPHSPYLVDEKYSRPYKEAGIPSPRAEFYGMIANIDENVGKLLSRLDQWKLRENTLVIFMTDNGSAAGLDKTGGFNAGMRALKASEYDGGHRVPCFLRWPARWKGDRDVGQLTAHIDLLPTLAELCGLSRLENVKWDGRSLVPLLAGKGDWPERTLFVHSQRVEHPQKGRKCAVMTNRWRLVNGEELYDMPSDPGQNVNLAARHADVVADLRRQYDGWWDDISTRFGEQVRIELGSPQANPVTLTCHDWHSDEGPFPFSHETILRNPAVNGYWTVEFLRPGTYEITLRARPEHVQHPLKAGAAKLKVDDREFTHTIEAGKTGVTFSVRREAGPANLQTWLEEEADKPRGAFFVDVKRTSD